MFVAAPATDAAEDRPAPPDTVTVVRRLRSHVLMAVIALGLAIYVTEGL